MRKVGIDLSFLIPESSSTERTGTSTSTGSCPCLILSLFCFLLTLLRSRLPAFTRCIGQICTVQACTEYSAVHPMLEIHTICQYSTTWPLRAQLPSLSYRSIFASGYVSPQLWCISRLRVRLLDDELDALKMSLVAPVVAGKISSPLRILISHVDEYLGTDWIFPVVGIVHLASPIKGGRRRSVHSSSIIHNPRRAGPKRKHERGAILPTLQ